MGCPTSCLKCATKFVFSGPVLSIDWLKGKSIGNHVYSHEILGGVRYPILSFYISSFIYIYISGLPKCLGNEYFWANCLLYSILTLSQITSILLTLLYLALLYSSTTFYITVKGRGTRQLWADGLPDAWGNLLIFMHLEVAIKNAVFLVDTTWFSLKSEISRWCSPQKNDHGCMVWYGCE